ncbi:MAG: DUF1275 domain-containing protein [Labilithrix sp.]|nr:DUF1275 domain-containing protein [Labilithrix sp.]MCW5815346.1 DUF1275 domain-containing protein [Labilithrix sp.]
MLTAAAGMVNALAFLATERFVSHVTGTATQLGMSVASFWLGLDVAFVIGSFVLGAMSASYVIDVRGHAGKRPLYALPLFVTAALVGGAGVAGTRGAFGPFGGGADSPADFAFLIVLAFAMGLQNGAVATSTGMVVRTTHLTGPATDLGLSLAELLFGPTERHAHARRHALLRAAKLVAFVSGAALAVPCARAWSYAALLVPAAAIALANALSFVDLRALGRAPHLRFSTRRA